MYKEKYISSKKYRIAFHKFPKTAKKISKVYSTGIRNWDAMDSKNYSVVIGLFRTIFSINKPTNGCATKLEKEK